MTSVSPAMQDAIDACYNSLMDPGGWADAMDGLAAAAGAGAACFYAEDAGELRRSFPASSRYQNFLEDFVQGGWWRTDHRAQRGWPRLRGGKRVLVEHDLVTDEERQTLPVYHDLYSRHDLSWWAAVSFRVGDRDWAMPLLRSGADGPFGGEARALLDIVPHLSRIIGIGTAMLASGSRDAVDLLELGQRAAISVDWSGRCTAFNAQAEALLGDDLLVVGGRLRAADTGSDKLLQGLVHAALQARSMSELPPTIAIRRSEKMPLVIDAIATPNVLHGNGLKLHTILLLTDLADSSRPDATKLRHIFGFTAAEARLAEQLGRGLTLAEAGERLEISHETARTQLKTIFARTGTNRQADLLRLLDRAHLAAHR